MPVLVADTLKPKNGRNFPVVESKDMKGGMRCVTSIKERDELLLSPKAEPGMLVYVTGSDGTNGKTYQADDNLKGYHEFNGTISTEQMNSVLEYVEANIQHTKVTEEDGLTYLELL